MAQTAVQQALAMARAFRGTPVNAPLGLGYPYQGTHTLGNWESDRAVDVSVPVGSPVYAVGAGTIGSQFGPLDSSNPRMAGLRLHLNTPEDAYYYAHLSSFAPGIKPGLQVQAGDVLGYSGEAAGVPHLHFGEERGLPQHFWGSSQTAPTATAVPAGSSIAQLIASRATALGVDPRAALAVAGQEGLGGGIGDYGTSFGPFQLHYGGAYPSWAPRGSQQASQAWAQRPAGMHYALNQIAGVAKGMRGREAVTNIVHRFERPLDKEGETARAWASYGGTAVPSAAALTPAAAPAGARPGAAPAVHTGANTAVFSRTLMNSLLSGRELNPGMILNAVNAANAHRR